MNRSGFVCFHFTVTQFLDLFMARNFSGMSATRVDYVTNRIVQFWIGDSHYASIEKNFNFRYTFAKDQR